jgi:hypothetical protein
MTKTDYDPDLVLIEGLSHFVTNFLQNLASCLTSSWRSIASAYLDNASAQRREVARVARVAGSIPTQGEIKKKDCIVISIWL